MMEDLMKPRFKVIASYPFSRIPVGSILMRMPNATDEYYTPNGEDEYVVDAAILLDVIKEHPHIFKPLKWWEERKIEEMPEY